MREEGKNARKGIVLRVVDAAVFILSAVIAAALLLSYLSPYADPNRAGWLAFLGLASPLLYVADLVLMLYWTLRWKPVALFLAAAALAGAGYVTRFFRPVLSQRYEQPHVPGTIRVLSYNVEGFFGRDSSGKRENQMEQIAAFIREVKPDIVCLQEFELNYINTRERFEGELEAWKYGQVFFSTDHPGQGRGLAIYSRYPVLKRGGIRYPGSVNSSMWVDVIVHRDTLRVFNNHMQSTQIDENDRQYLGSVSFADTLGEERAVSIARKLLRNFKVRAKQADSVARAIHDGTPRVIVCGDFNDTPMSYTYQRMRGGLRDAFSRKGRGMVATYRGLLGIFRIDYVFHSDDFETVDYDSEQPLWSDHNPVIVDLKLINR